MGVQMWYLALPTFCLPYVPNTHTYTHTHMYVNTTFVADELGYRESNHATNVWFSVLTVYSSVLYNAIVVAVVVSGRNC